MKIIFQYLLTITLLFITVAAFAQDYNISGIVVNEKGEPLKGVTVFIGGSERITTSDEKGQFILRQVPAGTFQLSAHIIGYEPASQNIIIKNTPITVELRLKIKAINLAQVNIGKRKASEKNLKLFKEKFLGTSANARQCEIINPDAINFSTKKGHLMADADDFLIIENKRLGYRLHYMLRGFDFSVGPGMVEYHGECSFEQLNGTDDQKQRWAKNRLETYQGSFMHFLRSVYTNNTLENGFITKPFYKYVTLKYDTTAVDLLNYSVIIDRLVKFDTLITAIDTNFVSLKLRQPLFVAYDPSATKYAKDHPTNKKESVSLNGYASILKPETSQAIIDKRGSYTDYHDFFINGFWAKARVGDQLPVEYQPPPNNIPGKAIATNVMLTSLQKWTDSIPQEKAYLHMDKPYYVPGDTIWFKGYLTTGSRHLLSHLSGAAYVDLIDDESKIVKSLKFLVDSGTVEGNLILDEDIKSGSYRIRAYTQWMRNAGEDYFFNRTITVGKPIVKTNIKQVSADLQQTDVQFFPESGSLVNGLTSRVGFKAVGLNGLGEPISGTITDNDNTELAQITTIHAGMGSFLLKPAAGKTYTANIKFSDGSNKSIDLPTAVNDGYVLSVYQPGKDSLLVRIQASANLQHSTVNLIVHSSGEVIYSSPVDLDGLITSVWLDKRSFPSGIAQFTIFDNKNEPLNERIAFIKNNDYMLLALKTEKPVYKSKEHVQLQLDAKDSGDLPVAANFSIAVIDENKTPVDENAESTIFSNILLTSDLKGYIEKPNYYFMSDADLVNKALDNLMLTQGYRRFEWKSISDIVKAKPFFATERMGYTISGTATTLNHKPLANADVLLLSMNARISRKATTDIDGRFRFDSLIFADSAKFAIQARAPNNSDHAIITLDSLSRVAVNIKPSNADVVIINTNLRKAEDDGKRINLTGHVLKQVDIKALRNKKNQKIVMQDMFSLPDEQSADHIYTIPDPDSFIDLKSFIQARISNLRIETDNFGNSKVVDIRPVTRDGTSNEIAIYVNGTHTSGDPLTDMRLEDIAKIELVRNNQAIINMFRIGPFLPAGFLFIVTKPPSERKHYYPNIVNIAPKGYNKVRQFYSPRYGHPNDITKPDLRSTIYWNPYVNTDKNGKATLDFYNADGPGDYRVVIEGIDAAGELGRQVYHYKVEL